MTDRFKDQVVLVTGGDSGIGKACALLFAHEGAKLVIANRSAKSGEEAAREIRQLGNQAVFVQTDVSQAQSVNNLIEMTVKTYGKLDCAVNNAGIDHKPSLLHEIPEEAWDKVISVNLKGVFLCTKYELAQMVKQGSGVILNMSSTAGIVGAPGMCVYSASKGGINQLTRTAAVEYAKLGIRVNALCPGMTLTPLSAALLKNSPETANKVISSTPLGRIASPEEVANASVWLCSNDASYITGVCLPVDGGGTAI